MTTLYPAPPSFEDAVCGQDLQDLSTCGRLSSAWRWRRLFLALKDALLSTYGQRVGLDLQTWEDPWEEDEFWPARGGWHQHILERWTLAGGTFHRPSNEFCFDGHDGHYERISPHFEEMRAACTGTIEGRRKRVFDVESRTAAFAAIKRLVRRHGALLNCGQPDGDRRKVRREAR